MQLTEDADGIEDGQSIGIDFCRFSELREIAGFAYFRQLVLGSHWNTARRNILLKLCVLVDEGNEWLNHL